MAAREGTRAPTRGRPRDPELDEVVLTATAALLGERGYQRLRVAEVADRAGVGLGALYRRWAGKRELVLAALERAVPDREIPPTDDPEADVLAGLRAVAEATVGPAGRVLGGLLPELADDPDLAVIVRERVLGRIREAHRERVRRWLGDAPDLDVRADLGPAHLVMQGLFLGRAVPDAELHALMNVMSGRAGR